MTITIRDRSLPDSRGIITQGSPLITADVNGDNGAQLPKGATVPCSNHYGEVANTEGEIPTTTAEQADQDSGVVAEGPQAEGASAYKVQKSQGAVVANLDEVRFSIGNGPSSDTSTTGRLPTKAPAQRDGPARGPAIWNPVPGKHGAL